MQADLHLCLFTNSKDTFSAREAQIMMKFINMFSLYSVDQIYYGVTDGQSVHSTPYILQDVTRV